jgi:hypothetical protein
MLGGGLVLVIGLALTAVVGGFHALLGVWFALGLGLSAVQTPIGRIITRSGAREERPALFAAQFSLSHGCWFATYPIAGVLGTSLGLATTASILASVAAAAVVVAGLAWRADAPRRIRPASVVHRLAEARVQLR